MNKKPFFIGYANAELPLRVFMAFLSCLLIAGAAMLGYLIGSPHDDPGDGAFRFDFSLRTVTGVVKLTPLPVLHLVEDLDHILAGHTLMLWRAEKKSGFPRDGVGQPSGKSL